VDYEWIVGDSYTGLIWRYGILLLLPGRLAFTGTNLQSTWTYNALAVGMGIQRSNQAKFS
jgi:hypothetical protein